MTASDIEDDFDLFDFTETVTYQRRDLTGTVTLSIASVSALKRATIADIQTFGKGSQTIINRSRWHIKASTISDISPKRGDRIVSATHGTWEVAKDADETITTRFACDTIKVS